MKTRLAGRRIRPANRAARCTSPRRRMLRVTEKVQAVLPEWEGFAHAVQAR